MSIGFYGLAGLVFVWVLVGFGDFVDLVGGVWLLADI